MLTMLDLDEPTSYKEVLTSLKLAKWMVVMRENISSMASNHVWEVVNLLPKHKTIGNKQVLKIKHKLNGSIDKY